MGTRNICIKLSPKIMDTFVPEWVGKNSKIMVGNWRQHQKIGNMNGLTILWNMIMIAHLLMESMVGSLLLELWPKSKQNHDWLAHEWWKYGGNYKWWVNWPVSRSVFLVLASSRLIQMRFVDQFSDRIVDEPLLSLWNLFQLLWCCLVPQFFHIKRIC